MTKKNARLKLNAPITLFVAVVLIQGIGTFAFLKKFKSANFLGLTIATLPLQLYCVYRISNLTRSCTCLWVTRTSNGSFRRGRNWRYWRVSPL